MLHVRSLVGILAAATGLVLCLQNPSGAQPSECSRYTTTVTQDQKTTEGDSTCVSWARGFWYLFAAALFSLALLTNVLSRRVLRRGSQNRRDLIVVGTPVFVMLLIPFVAMVVTHGYVSHVHSEVAKDALRPGLLYWTVLSALSSAALLWGFARMGRVVRPGNSVRPDERP